MTETIRRAALRLALLWEAGRAREAPGAQERAPSALAGSAGWALVRAPGARAAPWAGATLTAAARATPTDAALIYADAVELDGRGRPAQVIARPAFDPILLAGLDYLGSVALVRPDAPAAAAALAEGPLEPAAPIYDLALRLGRTAPETALHLPAALSWEPPPGLDAAARVATAHRLAAARLGAPVDPVPTGEGQPPVGRLRLGSPPDGWPAVTVVIPTRSQPELLLGLLRGLRRATDYPAVEPVVVDNGPDTAARAATAAAAAEWGAQVVSASWEFDFARMVNAGSAAGAAPLVLLLNDDVEILEPGWLKEMVACLALPGAAAVGARLLYPDGTVQHDGVVIGPRGLADHWRKGLAPEDPGPMGRFATRNGLSAVTGACLLTPRAVWERLGGFDGARFAVAYNDVDYCLRLRAAGQRVVWTPFATLAHHESKSRGRRWTPRLQTLFAREKAALRARLGPRPLDPAAPAWKAFGRPSPRGGAPAVRLDSP